jgi:hypothetical protein
MAANWQFAMHTLITPALFTLSLYVVPCRSLPGFVALKGQEKGNRSLRICTRPARIKNPCISASKGIAALSSGLSSFPVE